MNITTSNDSYTPDYALLGTTIATLLINIWQSIKMDHFKISCSNCCEMELADDNKPAGTIVYSDKKH